MNGFLDFMRRFQMPGGGVPQPPTTVPDQRIPGQIDPTMGMGRAPEPKRVPQGGWRDAAYMIGAGLREASGDRGQLAAAQEMFAGREQQARLKEIRDGLPPDQQVLFDLSPEAWVKAYGGPQAAPEYQIVNRGGGAYDVVDPRTSEVVRSADPFPQEPSAPSGFQWKDGKLTFIPGGPGDPDYVSRIAGERREAVTSRPMPRPPARGGGGRAPASPSYSDLPAGAQVIR